jgi:hypothetical protein
MKEIATFRGRWGRLSFNVLEFESQSRSQPFCDAVVASRVRKRYFLRRNLTAGAKQLAIKKNTVQCFCNLGTRALPGTIYGTAMASDVWKSRPSVFAGLNCTCTVAFFAGNVRLAIL